MQSSPCRSVLEAAKCPVIFLLPNAAKGAAIFRLPNPAKCAVIFLLPDAAKSPVILRVPDKGTRRTSTSSPLQAYDPPPQLPHDQKAQATT